MLTLLLGQRRITPSFSNAVTSMQSVGLDVTVPQHTPREIADFQRQEKVWLQSLHPVKMTRMADLVDQAIAIEREFATTVARISLSRWLQQSVIKMLLLDGNEQQLWQVIAQDGDYGIQIKFNGVPGEEFGVVIAMANRQVIENFVI